jgi:hypothetical protein
MVVPHTTVQLAPSDAPCRTRVVLYSSFLDTWLRGLTTLVNTIDGPQKTSSSRVQPVYTDTLFWILTLLPITTSGEITTFWPMLQPAPIRVFFMTWEKCQIFVPAPMEDGWST